MLPSVGELKVPIYKSTIGPVFGAPNGSPGPNFLNPAAGELTHELWFGGIAQWQAGSHTGLFDVAPPQCRYQ